MKKKTFSLGIASMMSICIMARQICLSLGQDPKQSLLKYLKDLA